MACTKHDRRAMDLQICSCRVRGCELAACVLEHSRVCNQDAQACSPGDQVDNRGDQVDSRDDQVGNPVDNLGDQVDNLDDQVDSLGVRASTPARQDCRVRCTSTRTTASTKGHAVVGVPRNHTCTPPGTGSASVPDDEEDNHKLSYDALGGTRRSCGVPGDNSRRRSCAKEGNNRR